MSLRIIETDDGSQSLYDDALNETYHSTRGAHSESQYVYIDQGLATKASEDRQSPMRVLEIGFGTGINAWLAWLWAENAQFSIDFHTLEPNPIERAIINELKIFEKKEVQRLHQSPWGEYVELSPFFAFSRYPMSLEEYFSSQPFDVIFFDAFAPSRQPDIWSLSNLKKCFDLLTPDGILTTYCAQGQFKRDLKEAGFLMEVLPGALGKKEMVRGRKTENQRN
jgi:tRNA U34 5-methylaminomethyl-2-thiouridine-forming methyltransferase MnmC